jgi:hypothetical protein
VTELRKYAYATSRQTFWPDNAPLSSQIGALPQALASRDAYKVFCTVLLQQQRSASSNASASATSSCALPLDDVGAVLLNAEREAESVALMLCACVAVVLNPAEWPPWVAAQFSSNGVASTPVTRSSTSKSSIAAAGEQQATSPSSPLHVIAAHTLQDLARRLPRASSSSSSSSCSSILPLLRWLAQLCGVCLAPSSHAALRLAQEVGKVSLDAAGIALKAHCDAMTVAVRISGEDKGDEARSDSVGATVAATADAVSQGKRWLSLWGQLTQLSLASSPSLPPFSLSTAVGAAGAESWSAGIAPAVVREGRVSWHLHCLLTVKETHHAARLLSGTLQDAITADTDTRKEQLTAKLEACDGVRDCAEDHKIRLPVTHAVQAELLASLPLQLLEEAQLGERLSFSLLTEVKCSVVASPTAAAGVPPRVPVPHTFVPSVSTHAVVFARMLRYLLSSTAQAQRKSSYLQHLHDLALLLSSANVYDLAASFVPADQPLTVVMVATKDTHREDYVQQVVSAVRAVVDVLCEEPTPLSPPAPQATSSAVLRDKTEALAAASGTTQSPPPTAAPAAFLVSGKGKKKGQMMVTRDSRAELQPIASTLAASSWGWREQAMDDVDGAVQAAVRLLTALMELCSSHKTSLPLRKSEPKWRRELRERTAVRAHKYELLLQELPHAELRAVLHTLLGHGYHREGSRLGVSLLKGDQVDLHYYTLPLLGSLYLAVSASAPPFSLRSMWTATVTEGEASSCISNKEAKSTDAACESDRWKQAVYQMYRRRFEIYGDADLNVTVPSYTTRPLNASTPSSSATGPLVCTPENELVEALVLASTAPTSASVENGTAELANCFLNRRVVVAGRGVVVDVGVPWNSLQRGPVFSSWLHKGAVTL